MSPKARPLPQLWSAHDPVLAYGSLGRGVPRIVHVHGLGARWQIFKPVMAGLQEHTQLAPDLRGHGLSGRAAGDYSVEAMAGDLIDLLEAHCPEPVVLSGHSLGGWVAMAAASRRPELIDGLVVIDSPLHSRRPDPSITRSYLADAPLALRAVSRSPEQLDPAVLEAYHVGPQVDAGAQLGRRGGLARFEHAHAEARLLQRVGRRQSGDAAADDHDLCSSHGCSILSSSRAAPEAAAPEPAS